jgi:succinyl-diaminopimelate desuccinylase
MTARITVFGTQGHAAYPHRADNPIHRLVLALAALTAAPLDGGTDWFEPSTLQVTTFDVRNPASNVIPAVAHATLNIRFNDHHSSASLAAWLRATLSRYAERFDVELSVSGESFLTTPGPQVETLRRAVAEVTGVEPRLDTGGGTSDARFIARYCPVAEFGLVGTTMHQVDERVPVDELRALSGIYARVLDAFGI